MCRWAPWVLAAALLAGCGEQAAGGPAWHGPIPANSLFMVAPGPRQLLVLDPVARRITRRVALPQWATDAALAPNGRLYIPLHENDTGMPGPALGSLDLRTGRMTRISLRAEAPHTLVISPAGIAFVGSGTEVREGLLMALVDTNANHVLGYVRMPGHYFRMTALDDNRALVAVSGEGGSNIYVVDGSLQEPKPLFPLRLPELGPTRMLLDATGQKGYLLYAGWDPADLDSRLFWQQRGATHAELEARLEVYDLRSLQRLRRISLPAPAAEMVLGPEGRIYVGHVGFRQAAHQLSVVDPQTGRVEVVKTRIGDPTSLLIRGGVLYAAAEQEPRLELFQLGSLESAGTIDLPDSVRLPYASAVPQPALPATAP